MSSSRHILARAAVPALAALLLEGCASTTTVPRLDDELASLARSAWQAYTFEGAARALPLYTKALDRARSLDDAGAIGMLACNLGACLLDAGRPAEAGAAFDEALGDLRRAGQPTAPALVGLAGAAFSQGRLDEARDRAVAATAPDARPDRPARVRARALQGTIALGQSDSDSAASFLASAEEESRSSPPAIRAPVAALRGNVALARKDFAQAGAAFEREAALWSEAGAARRVSGALSRAGRAHAQAGAESSERAAGCFLRAARAAAAGGDATGACGYLVEARMSIAAVEDDAVRADLGRAADRIGAKPHEGAAPTRL